MEYLNGDFLNLEIPKNIPLIVTDPPYLINYKDWDEWNEEFLRQWVEKCVLNLADNGTMWAFMAKDNLFTHKYCPIGLVNLLQEYGEVHLKNWITWSRQKGRGASKHLKSQREEIIHFTKHPTNYVWNSLKTLREVVCPYVKDGRPRGWFLDSDGMRKRWTGLGNSWVYSAPQWNGKVEKQWHPAQKPVMILERLIRLSSNEEDLVVDPFAGSFTTAIACKLSNRDFWGCEKEEKFFILGKQRIESFDIKNYIGYNDI